MVDIRLLMLVNIYIIFYSWARSIWYCCSC